MLGAIIGDIVGSPYEFSPNHHKSVLFPLFSERSRFTDDTVMTLAVAEGVMRGYRHPEATTSALIESMRKYGCMFPSAGYGQRFYLWLTKEITGPYGSCGNGSAMRVSSVAWAYDTLAEVEQYARITAEVTHTHPEGIKGACATAAAIFMARTHASKEDIRAYVTEQYGYDLTRTIEEIRPGYIPSSRCQGSVPEAITAYLDSTGFEDALRKAVSLGGDSDTLAAISGSIAEAAYGPIPAEMVNEALSRLDTRLLQIYVKWQDWLRHKPI